MPVEGAHRLTTKITGKEARKSTLLVILIFFLTAVSPCPMCAESPSNKFESRLLRLPRQGKCIDLPRFGISTHRGRNPDDINVKLATEIGADIVRIDIPWVEVEKDGRFDFRQFDYIVRQLRQKQKSMLLLLAYGHPDHTDGGGAAGFPFVPRSPEQQQAYLRYVQAAVQHFRGPDVTFQVWNEPNIEIFWTLNATIYGALLKDAAAAIRQTDPTAAIVAAGIANMENRNSFVREMIAATSLDQVNALAFHPYRRDGPENSILDIAEFERAAAGKGRPPAVWLTEWGYSESWLAQTYPQDNLRRRQAVMTARLMLTAAMAQAKAAIVYDLIDDGTDPTNPEFRFGLYDYDFNPKEAAFAFRTLTNLMSKCDTFNFELDPGRKMVTATFKDRLHLSHVIWTYDSRRNQKICFEPNTSKAARLSDITGRTLPVELCGSSSNIKLEISEKYGPLVLITDR